MARYGKWETVRELDRGGQGVVYLVQNSEAFDQGKWSRRVKDTISALAAAMVETKIPEFATHLGNLLEAYVNRYQSSYVGALKVLHGLGPSGDSDKAHKRMVREVEAFRKVVHPNLLRLLDADLDADPKWFVGEYHERGPLSKCPGLFRGHMLGALQAFRPVVEAVVKLHEAGVVHRDIKPANIFLASDDRLVLGDMGLVFFLDEARSRVTEMYENVGSRDWMPAWALGMRLEEIRPSFDVFCLGKLLWFMFSGREILRLWYWGKPEFDVEKQFPDDPNVKWARFIFERCIVQEQEDCLQSADDLLKEVDRILLAIGRNAQVIRHGVERLCFACGLGTYRQATAARGGSLQNFGLDPAGLQGFYVFACNHCGHVQLFSLPEGPENPPPAWKKSSPG